MAERLGVSRREADAIIASGQITIDGQPAVTGAKVDKFSKVCYNGKTVPFEADHLYLAFNKPVGYVCSRRAQGAAPTLYELLPVKYQKLKTVGRLDKDSSGLILLTNDGDFAFQMTHPKFRKNKVYEVELDQPLQPLHQQMISDFGVQLDDGLSKFTIMKNKAELPSRFVVAREEAGISLSRGFRSAAARELAPAARGFRTAGRDPRKMVSRPLYIVILTEGRNRQIRRTFAALGYKVTKLHRVQFGKYELGNLKPGKCVIIEP